MRIFKNVWFQRFARKQKISDESLRQAVQRAESGLIDADLGGGVIKQRIARPGQGKSGGFRTILLYMAKERAFFVYGFPKSDRDNLQKDEEDAFKEMASYVLAMSEEQLDDVIDNATFEEITND